MQMAMDDASILEKRVLLCCTTFVRLHTFIRLNCCEYNLCLLKVFQLFCVEVFGLDFDSLVFNSELFA
jgi:hypothetical protein